jgi:beta-lactamase regulating signal transducer with metallopeptidase domain
MTAAFNLNAIAQTSAVQIVDCLVEGTLIAIFAGLMLGLARRQNSRTRFAVWFSALIAIAASPLLGGAWWPRAASISAATVSRPAVTLPGSWALYLLGAWAAIAAWFLAGVGRGLWHLHVLRKSCVPVAPAALYPQLRKTLEGNQLTRAVALCTSDQVHVPTAIGLVKPAVVLPRWVMQELTADELNQILLHEFAHLRRWDDWTNLAQKIVKALFFFHPAVWWIEKKVSLEREMACDDAVLAETANPRDYAECLARLAEKTLIQRSLAMAQAALGRIRQTSLRVAQILDVNRPTGMGRAWKPAVSLVAAFTMVCVFGISREPRLIAFSDSEASVASPAMADSSINAGRGHLSTSLPIVNVSAKVVAQVPGAPFLARPVREKWGISKAKLTTPVVQHKADSLERIAAKQAKPAEQSAASAVHQTMVQKTLVHETNARVTNADAVPVAFTETFFVVVEDRANGTDQPVFQIQLWHVLVLHPAVDPDSNRIPPKQT